MNIQYYIHILQLVRDVMNAGSTIESDTASSRSESMFLEASSSKTDTFEAQSSKTSSEPSLAAPELDFYVKTPVENCEDCKKKSKDLKNMKRRLNGQHQKLNKQRAKITKQVNVSRAYFMLLTNNKLRYILLEKQSTLLFYIHLQAINYLKRKIKQLRQQKQAVQLQVKPAYHRRSKKKTFQIPMTKYVTAKYVTMTLTGAWRAK